MTYGPHTPTDRQQMLAALGIDSIDALFADIPVAMRADGLDLPPAEDELSLAQRLEALAGRNRVGLATFLGAGAYRHHIPPTVDQILSRGEFYTSYTPYQPEISQGTLQTIYEYQSLIAELTGLDVVSASHYDGGAATAEAALMTVRATRRERVLVSRAVHRHFVDTTRTYFEGGQLSLDELPTLDDGTTDLAALERAACRCRTSRRRRAPRPAQRVRHPRADGRGGPPRPRRRRAVRRGRRAGLARRPGAARPSTTRTSPSARASRSASRSSTAARTSACSRREPTSSARCPAGWSAEPRTSTGGAHM